MTFLQSIFLYGLFAAALPLLIHLFSRHRKTRVLFSSLYFLKILENRKIRNIKLRQILLLIVRTLILTLLAISFARPTFKTSTDSLLSEENRISAVIILDNSMSAMADANGESVFETLKQAAQEVIETLNDGDELYILSSTDTTGADGIEAVFKPEQARSKILSIEPSYRKADLTRKLESGSFLLKNSRYLFREIYLISDMQRTNFLNRDVEINSSENTRIFYINPVGSRPGNIGLTDVVVRNKILERGRPFTLRAVIRNFSEIPVRDVLVSIYFDGKRVGQNSVNIGSDAFETIDFQIIPEHSGQIEGLVEIEDDILLADNRRFFTADIPDKIPVLVIDTNSDASTFLRSVFSPDLNTPLDVRFLSPRELTSVNISDFEVLIYNGFSSFSESDVYRLRNFLSQSGGIMLFPSADSDIGSYNATISRAFSLPGINGFSGRLNVSNDPAADFIRVETIDPEHAVFSDIFKEENPRPDLPQVFFSADIAPTASTRNIMMLSNSLPFLTETRAENGTFMIFSSAPALSWNTFPLKGLFAPLLYRTVQYLAAPDVSRERTLYAGSSISFLYSGSAEDLNISDPTGQIYKLEPKIMLNSFLLESGQTNFPGIYEFLQKENVLRKFAVNPDPAESDLRPISSVQTGEILNGLEHFYLGEENDVPEIIQGARTGQEISRFIIGIIVFLLIAETLLQYEKGIQETEYTENA